MYFMVVFYYVVIVMLLYLLYLVFVSWEESFLFKVLRGNIFFKRYEIIKRFKGGSLKMFRE